MSFKSENILKIVDIMYISLAVLLVLVGYINGQNPSFPDCEKGPLAEFPICDIKFPSRERAIDLVSRMNVSEKSINLMVLSSVIVVGFDRL